MTGFLEACLKTKTDYVTTNSITSGVAGSRTAPPTIVIAVVVTPVTVSAVWSTPLIYKLKYANDAGNVVTAPASLVKSVLANVKSAPAAVPVAAVLTNLLPAIKGFTIGNEFHLSFIVFEQAKKLIHIIILWYLLN